jgi:hypothetical protein
VSEHTPGPWRIVQEDGRWIVRGANYDAICRLYAGGNGDLIVAAPELLAALKSMRAAAWENERSRADAIVKTEAAIAKAEGK